jgi:hypothetical protein
MRDSRGARERGDVRPVDGRAIGPGTPPSEQLQAHPAGRVDAVLIEDIERRAQERGDARA